jgi:hypothetical protein
MMAVLVSLGFRREADDTLVTFSNTVFQRMSTDTQYASLKNFVDDIYNKNQLFIASIADFVHGGNDRSDAKKACRADLEKLLVFVARQLEYLANDNPRFVTDSGYDMRSTTKAKKTVREKEPISTLDAPVLTVKNLDKSGYAEMAWDEVKNALYYGIQHKKREESAWTNGSYNHIGEFTFVNLASETVYEFQVRSMGPFGVLSAWSAPVPVFIT